MTVWIIILSLVSAGAACVQEAYILRWDYGGVKHAWFRAVASSSTRTARTEKLLARRVKQAVSDGGASVGEAATATLSGALLVDVAALLRDPRLREPGKKPYDQRLRLMNVAAGYVARFLGGVGDGGEVATAADDPRHTFTAEGGTL